MFGVPTDMSQDENDEIFVQLMSKATSTTTD